MNKVGFIILSGYNYRGILALCRWATYCDVPFYIIASGSDDLIFFTDYKRHVYFVRHDLELTVDKIKQWINFARVTSNCDSLLFYPSSEYLNLYLLKHRFELESDYLKIPLTNEHTYHQISYKKQFAQLCPRFDLHIPNQIDDISYHELFVAKPNTYFSSDFKQLSPLIICNENERELFLGKYNQDDFFYQEFVDGKSIYLFLCINKCGNHKVFSQENLIQQPGGKSIILARHSDVHFSSEVEKVKNMLMTIGFFGMIMIEFRLYDDTLYMIEANPRPWGPIQFLLDNNVDFFSDHFKPYGLVTNNCFYSNKRSPFYYWSGGFDKNNADYFNYSKLIFDDEYSVIKSCDLLDRKDTRQLYERQVKW